MKFMNSQYSALIFFLLLYTVSFSQNENKVIGTWAVSGNNVYLYDFADSGKVSITTCKNNTNPTIIANGWRIGEDGLFYLKEKKKSTYNEHAYQLMELNNSKMVLRYPSADFSLIFYKIEPSKKSTMKLTEDLFINQSFNVIPATDTLINKISFGENGMCTLHRKTTSGEILKSESHWNIRNRADNLFLLIDDFEILVFTNKNNSELEFTSYGFYRMISGIESVKLVKVVDSK